MTTASSSISPSATTPEFIIYSFEMDEFSKGSPVWQEYRRLSNEDEALRRADALFLSAKYTRVEVRRKSLDEKTGQTKIESVKVLDSEPSKGLNVALLLAASVACIAFAGILTYLNVG